LLLFAYIVYDDKNIENAASITSSATWVANCPRRSVV